MTLDVRSQACCHPARAGDVAQVNDGAVQSRVQVRVLDRPENSSVPWVITNFACQGQVYWSRRQQHPANASPGSRELRALCQQPPSFRVPLVLRPDAWRRRKRGRPPLYTRGKSLPVSVPSASASPLPSPPLLAEEPPNIFIRPFAELQPNERAKGSRSVARRVGGRPNRAGWRGASAVCCA